MRNSEYNELKPFLIRPTFLLFDLTGFLIVSLTFFIESGGVAQSLISIGSTIFTLGITLPIALYYQSKHNRESFKIIKSCEDAGILSIFVSRKDDDIDLKDAIEEAARTNSSEIFLLGIAFRSFFDPNVAHSSNIERVIENTTIKTRIMLLDPKSEAANRRAEIEKDGSTIDDINYTINHGIKSAVKRRIDNKIRNTPEIRELLDTYKGFDPTEKKQ
ncbi:MAG: hypothetical protein ACE5EA_09510, partial [Nitrospirota bacterium]